MDIDDGESGRRAANRFEQQFQQFITSCLPNLTTAQKQELMRHRQGVAAVLGALAAMPQIRHEDEAARLAHGRFFGQIRGL